MLILQFCVTHFLFFTIKMAANPAVYDIILRVKGVERNHQGKPKVTYAVTNQTQDSCKEMESNELPLQSLFEFWSYRKRHIFIQQLRSKFKDECKKNVLTKREELAIYKEFSDRS